MLKNSSCAGWHGAKYSEWLGNTSNGFVHDGYGVFSFEFDRWNVDNYCGRGVAVIGTGL